MHAHAAEVYARCNHKNCYELFDPTLQTKLTMDCENYARLPAQRALRSDFSYR